MPRVVFQREDCHFDVAAVALVIAIHESRADFSYVTLCDLFRAKSAVGVFTRLTVVDEEELHHPRAPGAKQ